MTFLINRLWVFLSILSLFYSSSYFSTFCPLISSWLVNGNISCLNCFAGLSLLEYPNLKAIDPAYALPVDVVNRIFYK